MIESFVPGEAWSKRAFDRESRDENLAILMKIATITAYAHREGGVVHRDLKPANVMLGKYDEIYLCDWGFAFVAAEGAQRNVAGSLAFAAPEQVRGEAVDFRADVFALGSILYKILTGVAPREGAGKYTLTKLFRRAETGEIDPIPEDAPEELRKIALKALAVDPEERYADAGEFADALTNWRRREQIWNRFVDLSLRFAFLREKFQEAERAKEKEKRDVWAARLGACVGLLNELTALRRETDEGEGEAEECETEAETRAARDRDLTLKFLNAEIAARSWLIDKTIQMKDFATATALTNEQIVATKRRFKIIGDAAQFEKDNKIFRAQRTDAALGNAKRQQQFWDVRTGLAFIFGVIVATILLFAWGAALAAKAQRERWNSYPQQMEKIKEEWEKIERLNAFLKDLEAEKTKEAAAPNLETAPDVEQPLSETVVSAAPTP